MLNKNTRLRLRIFVFLFISLFSNGTGIADEYGTRGLQPGEGRDLVLDTCTGCHSTAIILQNRMSRKRWDETLTWMQEKQGLQKLNQETRNRILDYLAKTQGPPDNSKGTNSTRKIYQFEYQPNPL
jgi:hypothetical protein